MAKIDELKEEINYLKVWLSIVVITTISLVSWLVGNYESENLIKVALDMLAVIILSISIVIIDKKIKERIKKLKDL
jgi:undecaprenyl pyrophosphate phosphatase UppP